MDERPALGACREIQERAGHAEDDDRHQQYGARPREGFEGDR